MNKNFWMYVLIGLIAIIIIAAIVMSIVGLVKYYDVPLSEVPWWVFWLS